MLTQIVIQTSAAALVFEPDLRQSSIVWGELFEGHCHGSLETTISVQAYRMQRAFDYKLQVLPGRMASRTDHTEEAVGTYQPASTEVFDSYLQAMEVVVDHSLPQTVRTYRPFPPARGLRH